MESDVPLIEIAGEDDSLVQLIQNDNLSSSNTNTDDATYFFCSPLQARRSKPIEKSQKPSSPLCRESVDKENTNTNANKLEEQKLSLQPQQMKRKKKGGGYNLRKSLAWDRAFFTDEGVLNSEELSMISGNANSNGLLSVIHEDTDCITDSVDLEAIDKKLFKVLPESQSSKGRFSGGSSLPKPRSPANDNAAPGSATRRKVLSACDVNRSGSKRSGCPRPVASSSLKRPANVNTMKSPTKEPKVSKLPVPKPDPCALSRTSKNATVGATDLKRNQIAPSVKFNTNSGPNYTKVASTGKSLTTEISARQARRNVVSLVKGSPAKVPCSLTKPSNDLKVIPKQVLTSASHASNGRDERSRKTAIPQVVSKKLRPLTGPPLYGRHDRFRKPEVPEVISKQAPPTTGHSSYGCDDRLRKTVIPLPHTCVNLLRKQLPESKASGLRKPSPSLGFFDQPISSMPSPLKTSSQPCIIPNLRKVGSVDPIHELITPSSLGKKKNVINDGIIKGNINVQGLSTGCSVSSTIKPAIKDNVEPLSQVKSMQKVELKVQSSSNCNGMEENQRKFNSLPVYEDQQSMRQAEPCSTEKVFKMGDLEFQRNDDKYPLQRGSREQLDKDLKVAFVTIPKINYMDTPCATSHLSSAAKFPGFLGKNEITDHQILEDQLDLPQKNCGVLSKSKPEDASCSSSILSDDQNFNQLLKPLASEGNQISAEDKMVRENTGCFTKECQTSEDIQSFSATEAADINPKIGNFSASELESSNALFDSKFEEQEKCDCSTFEIMSMNSHVEDVEVLAIGRRLTDEMNDVDLSTSASDNCQLLIVDCGIKKPEQLEVLSSHYIGEQVFQESGLHLNDFVVEGFSIFPEGSQQESSLHNVDSKEPEGSSAYRSESEVPRTPSLIPPPMLDGRTNVAETVQSQNVDSVAAVSEDNKIGAENDNLNSQLRNDFHLQCQDCSLEMDSMDEVQTRSDVTASFSESGDFTSQQNLKVRVEGGSAIKDIFETEECNLSVEICCGVPQLLPEADKSYCSQDALTEQVNLMSDEISVGKHSVEQAQLDMSSKVEGSGASGSKSPCGLSKQKGLDEANNEVDGCSDMSMESLPEDPPEKSSVSNCAYSTVSTMAYNSLGGELCSSVNYDQRSSSGCILQADEVNVLSSKTLAEEAEMNVLKDMHTDKIELQHESEDTLEPREYKETTKQLKKLESARKQDALVIKPPSDAAPFSDEWLAAIEAAGEEILTKKSGAVQNSPPNKSEPQLGPWSPVKRKASQVLGPFDCTKHNKIDPSASQ